MFQERQRGQRHNFRPSHFPMVLLVWLVSTKIQVGDKVNFWMQMRPKMSSRFSWMMPKARNSTSTSIVWGNRRKRQSKRLRSVETLAKNKPKIISKAQHLLISRLVSSKGNQLLKLVVLQSHSHQHLL